MINHNRPLSFFFIVTAVSFMSCSSIGLKIIDTSQESDPDWQMLAAGSQEPHFRHPTSAQKDMKTGPAVRPIVAVFDIETKNVSLKRSFVDALSDYLITRLAETGNYRVVPRAELKQRLLETKKHSYKECYDQACQIELGRELAAEKTVSTQIVKLGSRCKVNITLYDLKKAATDTAATSSGECTEDGLTDAMGVVVKKLISH